MKIPKFPSHMPSSFPFIDRKMWEKKTVSSPPFNLRDVSPRKRELIRLLLMKGTNQFWNPYKYDERAFRIRLRVIKVEEE